MHYSVLMSVYAKENPAFLRESLDSMFAQTVLTDDFVLVCDGPLSDGLNAVIAEYEARFFPLFHVLRIPENVGLGRALAEGLALCKNELVARMDSDDVSRPNRCEMQLYYFEKHPDISVISGTVEEFAKDKYKVHARRILPSEHLDIARFAKTRNPFNHPCSMFKKSDILAVGGYQSFYLFEDYYLWLRLLARGYKGANISTPLLWMRADYSMYKRRGGWTYYMSCLRFFLYMRKINFCSRTEFLFSIIQRTVICLVPSSLRAFLYKRMAR